MSSAAIVRDGDGGAYAMTVMTDQNPNESTGIALVEAITAHINSAGAHGWGGRGASRGLGHLCGRFGWIIVVKSGRNARCPGAGSAAPQRR